LNVARSETKSDLEKDIFDVKQVMTDYVWALDNSDWERLRKVFSDDIVFGASNMGHYEGGDNLVREFQNRTVRTPIRRHMLICPYVTIDGDTAVYTSYLINVRVRPGAPGGDYYWGTGYYCNSFRRTPHGWKMYDFKWEAILLEGNTQMVPAMGPMVYLPVMDGPADAPWGGAVTPDDAAFLSDSHLVENLMVGLVRAADAKVRADVAVALDSNVKARFGDNTLEGPDTVADYMCSTERGAWQSTFLMNTKVAASGDTALFGAYVYLNAPGAGDRAKHSGGVLTAAARRTKDGWRVTEYNYLPMWDRDQKILSDRATETDASSRPRQLWSLERERAVLRDEEEISQLMSRYTWAYDLNDFDQMTEIFHPDTDSSFHMGGAVYNIGRDQMLAMMKANRQTVNHSQHYIFNVDVKIGLDGNSAFMRCYVQTRRTHDDSGDIAMAGGFYYIHARRYDGQWKFDAFRYHRVHDPYM
jgi:ketosteroid isomerase-like protein